MHGNRYGHLAILLGCISLLTACQDSEGFAFLKRPQSEETAPRPSTATRLVERDIEAPEVFQVTESGLWDGRPSLGGVWIAFPDVTDPERVIIRNSKNGKFVIGALFRRERDNPGPRLQVSSDAAAALGMLAGAPTELNVTALRREEIPEPGQDMPPTPAGDIKTAAPTNEINSEPLAAAAAAIDKAEARQAAAPPPAPVSPPATPQTQSKTLDKPYIQIGIFSVEANANRTAETLRKAGIVPTIYDQESSGKRFWRVVAGPASASSDRAQLLDKLKGLGYSDAYFVTN
ncbi:cell division septation protein DedD [Rhodovulum bhavnagarense]|uniref:Cell division septation protein DedD n=1 Tax=Rhodovulum bhavnagarense TaxID=992286 RepID=A0A4R2RI49_9RHOB|nr:SPOR domain-containing protein [Rhodovulum bhavnagarense]TCP62358.1 cell division septation protein DedD [Rhodovulum bhavnagarense]